MAMSRGWAQAALLGLVIGAEGCPPTARGRAPFRKFLGEKLLGRLVFPFTVEKGGDAVVQVVVDGERPLASNMFRGVVAAYGACLPAIRDASPLELDLQIARVAGHNIRFLNPKP